jgi:predicted peptidase
LFIPGAGQFGNGSVDLPLLLNDGPAQLVDEKRFPGIFRVNGENFSFIVFTPQTETFPGSADISDCIAYAKKNYKIDSTRIYLSGLSIGSIAICNWAAENPDKVAAIVAMAGTPSDYDATNKYQKMADHNLPIWAFHSADDLTINVSGTKGFIAKIDSYNPLIAPRLTIWNNGGHDAWTRALNPSYKENGLNIYEWMLQYHR